MLGCLDVVKSLRLDWEIGYQLHCSCCGIDIVNFSGLAGRDTGH